MTEAIDLLEVAKTLIEQMAVKQPNHYLLGWVGTRIPHGASIDGIQIGWTQHGIVTGIKSERLGYYERMIDSGGAEGREQVMLISTTGTNVTPPAGGHIIDLRNSPDRPLASATPPLPTAQR